MNPRINRGFFISTRITDGTGGMLFGKDHHPEDPAGEFVWQLPINIKAGGTDPINPFTKL